MANQDNKNFVETMMDAQKQMMNTVVENTRKFTNGNALLNDTMDKGSEWYKNWLDNQKNVFGQTAQQTGNMSETMTQNAGQMNEFYQNWLNTQMNWNKQMWEMNLNWMKELQQKATPAATNPMEAMMNGWNNWTNQMNTWMGSMNNASNWMNMFNQAQSANPFSMDAWKKAGENWTGLFNQWYELLNNNFADLQKNFQNGTAQDAYRNMVNTTEGFTRFYEMWMPMWKSIQEKTFNMEQYKQWMNPALYKEFMDKFFGFMPENSRQYMQQFTDMMQNGMKQAGGNMMNGYQQMRQMAANSMPWLNGTEFFGNMLNGYNSLYNMMSNTVAPIARLMTPNQYTKSMMEWQDIANRMMVYNIKNSELQYLMYLQGTKVMDNLAENVMQKIQEGQEINSIMALYQEWMNISDKTFVQLFESDAYSQLMAEVSALQLKLRKDVEVQLEKMMVGMPVATRSEMDELYKTIYDLKKQVRQLEKMLEVDGEEAPEAEAENTTTTKASRSKKA